MPRELRQHVPSHDCLQGKRQPTPLQTSILNAYQTHQNINQASRRALQPATTTRLQNDGGCRDIVHGLRAMQNQPDHRRGLSSDAKRRAAYLDNVLQVCTPSSAEVLAVVASNSHSLNCGCVVAGTNVFRIWTMKMLFRRRLITSSTLCTVAHRLVLRQRRKMWPLQRGLPQHALMRRAQHAWSSWAGSPGEHRTSFARPLQDQ